MYNRNYLKIGMKIEMEHVNPHWTPEHKKRFAEKIAKDHLREYKSYYAVMPWAESKMKAIDRSMKRKNR